MRAARFLGIGASVVLALVGLAVSFVFVALLQVHTFVS